LNDITFLNYCINIYLFSLLSASLTSAPWSRFLFLFASFKGKGRTETFLGELGTLLVEDPEGELGPDDNIEELEEDLA